MTKNDETWIEFKEILDQNGHKYEELVNPRPTILMLKKNTFKIRIGRSMFTPDTLNIEVWKRTPRGGYKSHYNSSRYSFCSINDAMNIVEDCHAWPEVKKTENRFDKNKIVQNIIARELLPKLGEGSRIVRLAEDDGDSCKICCYSFEKCSIYQDRIEISWSTPYVVRRKKTIRYNMLHPSFDPGLLVKVIGRFAAELRHLEHSMVLAWDEAENIWHMEKRNADIGATSE